MVIFIKFTIILICNMSFFLVFFFFWKKLKNNNQKEEKKFNKTHAIKNIKVIIYLNQMK